MTVTLDETIALETVPGVERLFRVFRPFHFSVDGVGGVVPGGFFTDLASVPLDVAVAEPWILRPAVVHDLYCRSLGEPLNCPRLTRRGTNAAFLEAMRVCGASACQRLTAWLAVSVWTLFNWNTASLITREISLRSKIKQAYIR